MNKRLKSTPITRETLQNWSVAKMARERDDSRTTVASEYQLLQSRRNLVPDDADCSDFWVFGYGRLK